MNRAALAAAQGNSNVAGGLFTMLFERQSLHMPFLGLVYTTGSIDCFY